MELLYNDNYIGYEHGPIKSRKIIWPPESHNTSVKFAFYDLQKNIVGDIMEDSEWGLYKLFNKFSLKQYKKTAGKAEILLEYKKGQFDSAFTVSGDSMVFFTKDNPLSNFQLENGL